MQSILVSLPSRVSDEAMAGGFKPLSGGHVSMASDLFKAFTDDDLESSKLTVIRSMTALTCAEFEAEVKRAQKLADEVDAANGFVPASKPQSMEERYGIKRRVLNQRMSEAKRLFGVFKQAPQVLAEKGYASALIAARQWLSDNAKTWDGDNSLSKEEKAAKSERKALAKAIGDAVADGVSVESAVAVAQHQVAEDKINSLVKALVKQHDADTLFTVCLRTLESYDVGAIEDAIAYLSEAKMLLQSDVTPSDADAE